MSPMPHPIRCLYSHRCVEHYVVAVWGVEFVVVPRGRASSGMGSKKCCPNRLELCRTKVPLDNECCRYLSHNDTVDAVEERESDKNRGRSGPRERKHMLPRNRVKV